MAGELVTAINEGGYFDTTIAGHEKNIILKLAKGSEYPHAEFLDEIADEIRITVEANQIGSQAVALDDDDYDDVLGEKGYIGEQAAQEIISAQLGRDDLQFTVKEYELDDGIYEIEFIMDGVEYEYEVDAVTERSMRQSGMTMAEHRFLLPVHRPLLLPPPLFPRRQAILMTTGMTFTRMTGMTMTLTMMTGMTGRMIHTTMITMMTGTIIMTMTAMMTGMMMTLTIMTGMTIMKMMTATMIGTIWMMIRMMMTTMTTDFQLPRADY